MSEPLASGLLTALFLLMAILYASVGQGGGSGYLAAMAMVGLVPENIRQTARTLNVVVVAIGLVRFARAGFFDGRLCLPFVVASVPLAFLGGALSLPADIFKLVVAVILLWAAILLLWRPVTENRSPPAGARPSSSPWGLVGASGFILVNSLAALVKILSHQRSFSTLFPLWVGVVAVGEVGRGGVWSQETQPRHPSKAPGRGFDPGQLEGVPGGLKGFGKKVFFSLGRRGFTSQVHRGTGRCGRGDPDSDSE